MQFAPRFVAAEGCFPCENSSCKRDTCCITHFPSLLTATTDMALKIGNSCSIFLRSTVLLDPKSSLDAYSLVMEFLNWKTGSALKEQTNTGLYPCPFWASALCGPKKKHKGSRGRIKKGLDGARGILSARSTTPTLHLLLISNYTSICSLEIRQSMMILDQNGCCGYVKKNCWNTASSCALCWIYLEGMCRKRNLLLLIKKVRVLLLQAWRWEDRNSKNWNAAAEL